MLACDMSLERAQFLRHNPVIRLNIVLTVLVLKLFEKLLAGSAPTSLFKINVWSALGLNRNPVEETQVQIDKYDTLGHLKGLKHHLALER